MTAIDTALLAPAAAATLRSEPMRKRATVALNAGGDTETIVEMTVSYDLNSGFYHGQITRTTKKLNPDTGWMILVKEGPNAPGTVRLLSKLDMWSKEYLDAMYAQAFETLTARLAAGDEKVTAILASQED